MTLCRSLVCSHCLNELGRVDDRAHAGLCGSGSPELHDLRRLDLGIYLIGQGSQTRQVGDRPAHPALNVVRVHVLAVVARCRAIARWNAQGRTRGEVPACPIEGRVIRVLKGKEPAHHGAHGHTPGE